MIADMSYVAKMARAVATHCADDTKKDLLMFSAAFGHQEASSDEREAAQNDLKKLQANIDEYRGVLKVVLSSPVWARARSLFADTTACDAGATRQVSQLFEHINNPQEVFSDNDKADFSEAMVCALQNTRAQGAASSLASVLGGLSERAKLAVRSLDIHIADFCEVAKRDDGNMKQAEEVQQRVEDHVRRTGFVVGAWMDALPDAACQHVNSDNRMGLALGALRNTCCEVMCRAQVCDLMYRAVRLFVSRPKGSELQETRVGQTGSCKGCPRGLHLGPIGPT